MGGEDEVTTPLFDDTSFFAITNDGNAEKKRRKRRSFGRRVSFAEQQTLHIFPRDDEYETPRNRASNLSSSKREFSPGDRRSPRLAARIAEADSVNKENLSASPNRSVDRWKKAHQRPLVNVFESVTSPPSKPEGWLPERDPASRDAGENSGPVDLRHLRNDSERRSRTIDDDITLDSTTFNLKLSQMFSIGQLSAEVHGICGKNPSESMEGGSSDPDGKDIGPDTIPLYSPEDNMSLTFAVPARLQEKFLDYQTWHGGSTSDMSLTCQGLRKRFRSSDATVTQDDSNVKRKIVDEVNPNVGQDDKSDNSAASFQPSHLCQASSRLTVKDSLLKNDPAVMNCEVIPVNDDVYNSDKMATLTSPDARLESAVKEWAFESPTVPGLRSPDTQPSLSQVPLPGLVETGNENKDDSHSRSLTKTQKNSLDFQMDQGRIEWSIAKGLHSSISQKKSPVESIMPMPSSQSSPEQLLISHTGSIKEQGQFSELLQEVQVTSERNGRTTCDEAETIDMSISSLSSVYLHSSHFEELEGMNNKEAVSCSDATKMDRCIPGSFRLSREGSITRAIPTLEDLVREEEKLDTVEIKGSPVRAPHHVPKEVLYPSILELNNNSGSITRAIPTLDELVKEDEEMDLVDEEDHKTFSVEAGKCDKKEMLLPSLQELHDNAGSITRAIPTLQDLVGEEEEMDLVEEETCSVMARLSEKQAFLSPSQRLLDQSEGIITPGILSFEELVREDAKMRLSEEKNSTIRMGSIELQELLLPSQGRSHSTIMDIEVRNLGAKSCTVSIETEIQNVYLPSPTQSHTAGRNGEVVDSKEDGLEKCPHHLLLSPVEVLQNLTMGVDDANLERLECNTGVENSYQLNESIPKLCDTEKSADCKHLSKCQQSIVRDHHIANKDFYQETDLVDISHDPKLFETEKDPDQIAENKQKNSIIETSKQLAEQDTLSLLPQDNISDRKQPEFALVLATKEEEKVTINKQGASQPSVDSSKGQPCESLSIEKFLELSGVRFLNCSTKFSSEDFHVADGYHLSSLEDCLKFSCLSCPRMVFLREDCKELQTTLSNVKTSLAVLDGSLSKINPAVFLFVQKDDGQNKLHVVHWLRGLEVICRTNVRRNWLHFRLKREREWTSQLLESKDLILSHVQSVEEGKEALTQYYEVFHKGFQHTWAVKQLDLPHQSKCSLTGRGLNDTAGALGQKSNHAKHELLVARIDDLRNRIASSDLARNHLQLKSEVLRDEVILMKQKVTVLRARDTELRSKVVANIRTEIRKPHNIMNLRFSVEQTRSRLSLHHSIQGGWQLHSGKDEMNRITLDLKYHSLVICRFSVREGDVPTFTKRSWTYNIEKINYCLPGLNVRQAFNSMEEALKCIDMQTKHMSIRHALQDTCLLVEKLVSVIESIEKCQRNFIVHAGVSAIMKAQFLPSNDGCLKLQLKFSDCLLSVNFYTELDLPLIVYPYGAVPLVVVVGYCAPEILDMFTECAVREAITRVEPGFNRIQRICDAVGSFLKVVKSRVGKASI